MPLSEYEGPIDPSSLLLQHPFPGLFETAGKEINEGEGSEIVLSPDIVIRLPYGSILVARLFQALDNLKGSALRRVMDIDFTDAELVGAFTYSAVS